MTQPAGEVLRRVTVVAEAPRRTRVELEHRNIDRHGPGWKAVSDGVGDDSGWTLYLARYAALFVICPQARKEMPANLAALKAQVEKESASG